MAIISIILFLTITIGIYSLLAVSLNLQWGETDLMNFGVAAFFGIGAYASVLLTTPVQGDLSSRTIGFELPIAVGLVAAFVLASLVGAGLAVTSIRVRGDYFAMVTLAFGEIVNTIASNEGWLTSGERGIPDVPPIVTVSKPIHYDLAYTGLVIVVLLLIMYIFQYLSKSPFGRVLRAIREDENVPQALGKNTALFKIKSFAIGSGLAGFAGGLWAHYLGFMGPGVFPLVLTFTIWTALIVGGPGEYKGVIVGTILIMSIFQITRYLPGSIPLSSDLPFIRIILIGVTLIVVMYYRPHGILGNKERYMAGRSDN